MKQSPTQMTRQREAVLEVVRESMEHLTASEVFEAAKVKLPSISFATVYNSLRFLKDAGMIAEIQFGNDASRYDRMTERHDHALCTKCGMLIDLFLEAPGDLMRKAAKLSKFKAESIQFTLRGVCAGCQ
jgi:Fur family peroxide stress response transcriptional regulator